MGKLEDLEKVQKLKESGAITQEEFDIEKAKILNEQTCENEIKEGNTFYTSCDNKIKDKKNKKTIILVCISVILVLIYLIGFYIVARNTIINITQLTIIFLIGLYIAHIPLFMILKEGSTDSHDNKSNNDEITDIKKEGEETMKNTNNKKSNKKTIIIALIIILSIVAIIAGVVCFINSQNEKPIKIVKEFITATQEDDTKTLEKLFDTKGFAAWKECDENIDDFQEEYKKIDDNKVNSMIEHYTGQVVCSSLVTEVDYMKYTYGEKFNMSLLGEPTMEKIAPSMYEVTVNLKAKIDGETRTQKVKFIVYKDRIIYDTPIS